MRRDHAAVAARRILQAIAQHIANDVVLQAHIADLLSDEFDHVIRQTVDDLRQPNPEGEQIMSRFVLEHELTELRDNLDAVVDIIGDVRDSDDDRPRDALNWAAAIVAKAADFVADRIKEGTEQ